MHSCQLLFDHFQFALIHGPNIPGSYALYSIRPCFHHQSHPQLGVVFVLAPSLHSFWSYFSTVLQYHIGHLPIWGVQLSVSYLFAFSNCSSCSQGKNTEVVCHSLLQQTTLCQMCNFRATSEDSEVDNCCYLFLSQIELKSVPMHYSGENFLLS